MFQHSPNVLINIICNYISRNQNKKQSHLDKQDKKMYLLRKRLNIYDITAVKIVKGPSGFLKDHWVFVFLLE